MLKRWLLVFLSAILLISAFSACKGKKSSEDATDGSDTSDLPTTNANEDVKAADTLGKYNFGGNEFTILSRLDTAYEFETDAEYDKMDWVEKQIYERNQVVEDRFNVSIDVLKTEGGWDKQDTFISKVRAEYYSNGTESIDLVSSHSSYLSKLAVEGMAIDMSTRPEMDFSKVWWNENLYNELNIDGHLYIMIGDLCLTLYEYLQVVFVNETQFNNFFPNEGGIEALYDIVQEGEWTWDLLKTYAAQFGSGSESKGGDGKYGLLMSYHSLRACLYSQDLRLFNNDEETGRLYMPPSPSEKMISVMENLLDIYNTDNFLFPKKEAKMAVAELNPVFMSGNALFYPQMLGEVKRFAASMADSYGLVPYPKYDTYQDHYTTICCDEQSGIMIMNTSDNVELAAVCTEALSMYSYRKVVPVYYETYIKIRYLNDPRFGEMLDNIREGLTCYPGRWIKDIPIFDKYLDAIMKNNLDVASIYATQYSAGKEILTEFYTRMERDGLI